MQYDNNKGPQYVVYNTLSPDSRGEATKQVTPHRPVHVSCGYRIEHLPCSELQERQSRLQLPSIKRSWQREWKMLLPTTGCQASTCATLISESKGLVGHLT